MNKKSILFNLLLTLSTITITIIATEQPTTSKTEFEKFVERFAPPEDVKRTIERAPQWPYFGHIEGKEESPDIYAKSNHIERIINAFLLNRALNHSDKIAVAQKHFVLSTATGQWGVAAEFIEQDTSSTANRFSSYEEREQLLSYEEVEQLMNLSEAMCPMDFQWGSNMFRNKKNGKITFIDVENRSFGGIYQNLGKRSKEDCVAHLHNRLFDNTDTVSKTLLRNRVTELSQTEDGTKKRNFLKEARRTYNDTDIDFEKVEKEFYQHHPKIKIEH